MCPPHPRQLYTEFSAYPWGLPRSQETRSAASCGWASLRRRRTPISPTAGLLAAACSLQLPALTQPLLSTFVSSSSPTYNTAQWIGTPSPRRPPVTCLSPSALRKAWACPFLCSSRSQIIAVWMPASPSTREPLWVGLRLCGLVPCPWQGLDTEDLVISCQVKQNP